MAEISFKDKKVLVVGGSSGIGNGIARAFLEDGATVYVWGTRERAEDYDPAEGSDLSGLIYSRVDVADRDQIDAWPVPFEKLDVLVLCQGIVRYGRAEFERAGWDEVMSVNLDSLMACSARFRPHLRAAQGALVIISSISAIQANIGNPAYSASKACAVMLTRVLGKAWRREGIRVNGVAPGLVDTKLIRVTTQNPERLAKRMAEVPAGRQGTPDDMARAVLFLASPWADYIVGQTLIVDGGMSLH